jgi:hypothetical protein
MKLPHGRLLRSRVVTDLGTGLVTALDRSVTGYAVLEPQASLLGGDAGEAVITFRDGVPVAAYHTGTDRGGPPALADLAATGPYRLELFAVPQDDLAAVHDVGEFRVPPGMPAQRLAGDAALADRTRSVAPDPRTERPPGDGAAGAHESESGRTGAVEAFLDDEAKIDAIRENARQEASERAEQWGLADLADDAD